MRAALAALCCLLGQGVSAACSHDAVTVAGDFGQARFSVSVADEPEERSQGLMFVEEMAMFEGMLFVYERPQQATFWMKNTLIPLDMLFAGPDGTVLTLHENAVPEDLTTINGGDGVSHVLEINGGLSARLGLSVGDVLQHPSFGDAAVLPCG